MEFKEFKNENNKILKEYWLTQSEWDALDKATVQEGDIYHIVGTIDKGDLSAYVNASLAKADSSLQKPTATLAKESFVKVGIDGTQKFDEGSYVVAPSTDGTAGQVLKKTATGTEWADESGGDTPEVMTSPFITGQYYLPAGESLTILDNKLYIIQCLNETGNIDTFTVHGSGKSVDGKFAFIISGGPVPPHPGPHLSTSLAIVQTGSIVLSELAKTAVAITTVSPKSSKSRIYYYEIDGTLEAFKGDKGDTGVGISSITKDSDGNLVITMTDGTTTTIAMGSSTGGDVTLAGDNTFTGANTFAKSVTFAHGITNRSSMIISPTGATDPTKPAPYAIYNYGTITLKASGVTGADKVRTLTLPTSASGTLALTSDIPIKSASLDGTTLNITLA